MYITTLTSSLFYIDEHLNFKHPKKMYVSYLNLVLFLNLKNLFYEQYYKDPVTGRRFRSKNEVTSFLETGHGCKYKSHIQFVELSIPMHPVSASFLPNRDYRKDSVESARFPYGKDLAENASFSHRKDLVESASFPYRKDSSESASLFLDVSHSTSGSCNGSLERISIKQEQDVMRDEQIGCVDGVIEPCQLGGLIKSRHTSSKEEYNLLETNPEPGLFVDICHELDQ